MINELPPVNPQEPCEDCISRKALLEEVENGIKAGNYEEGYEEYQHINDMDDIIECIKYADSVQPKAEQEPKTGHWIERRSKATGHIESVCSECGAEEGYPYNDYCGNCGCRMVEPRESEDKE